MEIKEGCPFKSPKELGLTPKEYSALIKTLLLMEAGKVVHAQDLDNQKLQDGEYGFRMAVWRGRYPCGTVCCIGGTAEMIEGLPDNSLGLKAHEMAGMGDHEMYNLFYRWGAAGGNPSPKKAAQVLRGYLTTGQTKW